MCRIFEAKGNLQVASTGAPHLFGRLLSSRFACFSILALTHCGFR